MKKLISLFLAVTMLLSLCGIALADDVVELELVFPKPEASAISGLQAVIDAFNAQTPASAWCSTRFPTPRPSC